MLLQFVSHKGYQIFKVASQLLLKHNSLNESNTQHITRGNKELKSLFKLEIKQLDSYISYSSTE